MTAKKNDLPIGRIAGLFGLRGELKCDPTSSGRTLFSVGASLRCELSGSTTHLSIASVREHKGRLLIRPEGVNDATGAQRYIGATFFASRDVVHLEPGEHLDVDLIGCHIVGLDGTRYGAVTDVEHYPGSDMLVVGKRMIPMVQAFVRTIDTAAKEITVDVIPGLLDDEETSEDR